MFIFDFVADVVLDQIVDWIYGKIISFLNDFFAMMNNMGVELFELPWICEGLHGSQPVHGAASQSVFAVCVPAEHLWLRHIGTCEPGEHW